MKRRKGRDLTSLMNTTQSPIALPTPQVWAVGALCHAVADALNARFNPVIVHGELTGFSRASSGHCYFSLKDEQGQLRCAMFRRAASLLDFAPRDGQQVQVRGRLTVYEPRGDLQLVVESMQPMGQGALFEQFLRLKAKLELEGLFDPARKRVVPAQPRAIGLVTSLGAAALHDVVTALQRRVPHIPVVLAPAAVQGSQAPAELVRALQQLYALCSDLHDESNPLIAKVQPEVILLVRGGGSIEDLWAFNDEALARTLLQSPVPVICGVGHESDFTIADFVADLRAPTPTAAAELAAQPRQMLLEELTHKYENLRSSVRHQLERHGQRLDHATLRLGRPSALLTKQQQTLFRQAQRLRLGVQSALYAERHSALSMLQRFKDVGASQRRVQQTQLQTLGQGLELMNPHRVLERGYAILSDAQGRAVTRAAQAQHGQTLQASLIDGEVDLSVLGQRLR